MEGGTTLIAPRLGRWPESGLSAADMERLAPSLSRLLARSRMLAGPPRGLDGLLAESLGLEGAGLPWARALLACHDLPVREGVALCFRLFHARADISNALAQPAALSKHDSSIIINDLSDEFKADAHFDAVSSGAGILWLREVETPRDLPHVRDLYGQPLAAWYQRLRSHRDWYRLHNEMQMFLHLHPLNRERERLGQPLVNALWCWGAGEVPERPSPLSGHADDEDTRALFALCALGSDTLEGLMGRAAGSGRLVVWSAWSRILQEGAEEALDEALQRLDRSVVMPLLEAKQPIRLLTGDGLSFVYQPASRFLFWRRGYDWQRMAVQP